MKIYHIDSSARKSESVSKSLAKLLVDKIKKSGDTVQYRDVSTGLPFVAGIKGAGFIIPENERTEADKKLFKISEDRKSTRLNSSHVSLSRMPSSA